MITGNQTLHAIDLFYRLSDTGTCPSAGWQPLADTAVISLLPIHSPKIPKTYFDPDSLCVGRITLSGLSESANSKLVIPKADMTLDLKYTDASTGVAELIREVKLGPLAPIDNAALSTNEDAYQASCQWHRPN